MSSKEDIDADPARQLHCNEKDELEQARLRFYQVYAQIGESILALITGKVFNTACSRLTLLIQGAWLPGLGCTKTIAALTNKAETAVDWYLVKYPRPKRHFGRQVYYALTDMATDAQPQAEVAPVKRKTPPVQKHHTKNKEQ